MTGQSALVSISTRADAQNEDCSVLRMREDHSPTTDPQSECVVAAPLQATNISLVVFCEFLYCGCDPVLRRSVETGKFLEGSLGPFNPRAHLVPRSRRLTSSWATTSPLAFSSSPSRIAAK